MNIELSVDGSSAIRALGKFSGDLTVAIATALNRTGEDANYNIRQEMARRFTIRDQKLPQYVAPRYLGRAERATPTRLVVTLQTQGKGHILDPFETGAPKVAKSGLQPVAVPTANMRADKQSLIPRIMYPSNLGLVPRQSPTGQSYYALGKNAIKNKKTPFKTTASGKIQIQGKRRTFVLDPSLNGVPPSAWGVYQRVGPARTDVKLIWSYRNSVRRPPRLGFVQTIERTVQENWPVNLRNALLDRMRAAQFKAARR